MRSKKVTAILLAAVIAVLPPCMTGCNSQKGQAGAAKGVLTVYYYDRPDNALYPDALDYFAALHPKLKVNIVRFDKAADMDFRISTELGAGKGPDVMLFFANDTTLDTNKMAKNGAFADLSPYFKQSGKEAASSSSGAGQPSSKYFKGILESGQVNGKQYLVPLYTEVQTVDATKEQLKRGGITPGDPLTFDGLSQMLMKEIARVSRDPDYAAVNEFLDVREREHYDAGIMSWLQAANLDLVDLSSGKIVVRKEPFRKVAELYKAICKTRAKQKQFDNLKGAPLNQYTFTICPDFGSSSLGYQMENEYTWQLPEYGDPSKHTQIVTYYGAVNGASKNPEAGGELLSFLMDYDQDGTKYSKVNKQLATDFLKKLYKNTANIRLTDEDALRTAAVLDSTDRYIIPNTVVAGIVNTALAPYYSDVKSFDDCYADLLDKLKIYVSE